MKITLRKRKLKSGTTSLYLDIYANSKREYEYLNLYLSVPKTKEDREENKRTLQLAEAVRGERLVQLQNGTFGFKTENNSTKDFLAFYASIAEEKRNCTESTHITWTHTLKHLKAFSNNNLTFKDVNEKFLEGFKNYLLTEKLTKSKTRLSQNSVYAYFNKLRAAVNKAFEMGLIERNPLRSVKAVKQADSKRQYLTIEEVKKLSETECRYDVLKRAFLFSVLTGLRWSDINKLIWSEIKPSEQTGTSIMFRQKKTDGQEYLPISEQALALLGERDASDERVFTGLKYSAYMNVERSKWVMKAGITKDITFHCARHTHATLLLTNGIDLYTVSKLLGHRDIKTTQIYAKIVDQKKISAVNSIPKIF
jgi:integrase